VEPIVLVDFGSTYTKLTLVCKTQGDIIATAKAYTTVDSDIMTGYFRAFDALKINPKMKEVEWPDPITYKVCSSAAGGLKMSVSGLVQELTVEAAKLACLGSGAKILSVYSNKLTHKSMSKLVEEKPDIIMLSGGTNGGNVDCIMHNASLLAQMKTKIPVVVAGNNQVEDEIGQLLIEADIEHVLVENVMPQLNEINIEPARDSIRTLFMERIIDAKGLSQAREKLNREVIPTPLAVLRAAELLSTGTSKTPGWGQVLIVDIGGATTDVHSICHGHPTSSNVVRTGLIEPRVKRTVEGDLGMRVSALSLYEAVGESRLSEVKESLDKQKKIVLSPLNRHEPNRVNDFKADCMFRVKHTDYICKEDHEKDIDDVMASCAVELAVERHAGRIESVYSPMGMIFYQKGKDLSKVEHIIGTGGILVHSGNAKEILSYALWSEASQEILKPKAPQMYIDRSYILSCAGLLARDYPELSMKIMNKYIVGI